MTPNTQAIHIAVAIIQKNDYYLLGFRDKTQHQGGLYEFVGGKVEAGETALDALKREVCEEVGLTVLAALAVKTITHNYGDKQLCLHVFWVTHFTGEAHGREGQRIIWADTIQVSKLAMPAANKAIKRIAQLRPEYTITKDIAEFDAVAGCDSAAAWLAFYAKNLSKNAQVYVRVASLLDGGKAYAQLIANLKQKRKDVRIIAAFSQQNFVNPDDLVGFHVKHHELMGLDKLTRSGDFADKLFIAATHDEASIKKADALDVDAVTISPVKPTSSHASATPLGLDKFAKLASQANCPVYALGGMQPDDLVGIKSLGVFGVAGMSHFINF